MSVRHDCDPACASLERHRREPAWSWDGGWLALLRAFNTGGPLSLDYHAVFEGSKRYFLNKLGGLGQDDFGPLRDLPVLDHGPEGTDAPPGYDRLWGVALADAFAAGVPEDTFFQVLNASTVTEEDSIPLPHSAPRAGRKHFRAPTSAGLGPRTVRHVQDTGQRLASVVTRPSA